MGKTISVINQKGGVGKSTTAQALAAGLSLKGFKVLILDLDPQMNTSLTFKADPEQDSMADVLGKKYKTVNAIQKGDYCDIICGNKALASADVVLNDTGKEYRIQEALEQVKDSYDYIILDTPPALGVLTVNALTASDTVIIPAQADIYSISGIADLTDSINAIIKYCNRSLKIEGILLTRYNPRLQFNRELSNYANQMAENLKTKLYTTTIREAIAIRKAQVMQKSIFDFDANSNVAKDYMAFVEEFLEKETK